MHATIVSGAELSDRHMHSVLNCFHILWTLEAEADIDENTRLSVPASSGHKPKK